MKVIAKTGITPFSNSLTCKGFGYEFGDKDLNIAVATITGRYPDKGHLVNEVCKEIAYVLSGSGQVGVDNQTYDLHPGDAVLILPGERYFWQGQNLQMLMPCSPAFDPQQHKEVD